jgi:Fur family ferric uptake transcriptional regulator
VTCEADAIHLLRQRGYRVTPQRALILRALRHANGHITAGEIARQVQEHFPTVDLSTVYRTLALLKELRLVTETDLGAGDARYEWAPEQPHHHLICTACGAIQVLEHGALATLQRTLDEQYGFDADLDHFAIFGRCRACRAGGGGNGRST